MLSLEAKQFFLKMNLRNFKVDIGITKQLFKIGVPSSISQAVISLGSTVILGRVNTFGAVATAVHGIGSRLESLLFMPAMGLSQAASSIVGQNLGANQKERAYESGKYAIKAVFFIILLILGIIFAIFPSVFFLHCLQTTKQSSKWSILRLWCDIIFFRIRWV